MTKIEIANSLGINESEVTDDIIFKIERIEKEGFSLKSFSTKNYVTIKEDFLDEKDFKYFEGIDYKILTYEKENQKRYCILDNENNLINMPLAKLNYADKKFRNNKLIRELEEIQQNFKDKGIEISKCEIYNALNIDKIKEYKTTYGENYFENYFKDFYNILNTLETKNPDKIYHELFETGMNKQAAMITELSDSFMNKGENHSQQSYITNIFYDMLKQKELQKIKEDSSYIPNTNLMTFFGTQHLLLEKAKEIYTNTKNKAFVDNVIKTIYQTHSDNGNVYYPIVKETTKTFIDCIKNDKNFKYINYNTLQNISYKLKNIQEVFDVPPKIVESARKNICTQLLENKLSDLEIYNLQGLLNTALKYPETIQNKIDFIHNMSNPNTDIKTEINNSLLRDVSEMSINEDIVNKYKNHCQERLTNLINDWYEKLPENPDFPNYYYTKYLSLEISDFKKAVNNAFYGNPTFVTDEDIYKMLPENAKNKYIEFIEKLELENMKKNKKVINKEALLETVNYIDKNLRNLEGLYDLKETINTALENKTMEDQTSIIKLVIQRNPTQDLLEKIKEICPEEVLKQKEIQSLINNIKEANKDLDEYGSLYIPKLMEQLRLKDIETAKEYIPDAFNKCYPENIPELMKQIRLIDNDLAKEYIPKTFEKCIPSDIPILLEQIRLIDPEIAKKYIPKAIDKCNESYPKLIEQIRLIEPNNLEKYINKDIIKEFVEKCNNSPYLMYELRQLNPENPEKFIDREIILETIKKCDSFNIPELMEQIRLIDSENPEKFIDREIILETIKKCDSFSIPELMEQIRLIDNDLAKEYMPEAIEKCKPNVISNLMEQTKLMDIEIAKEYMPKAIEKCIPRRIPELMGQIVQLKDKELIKSSLSEIINKETMELDNLKEIINITLENKTIEEQTDIMKHVIQRNAEKIEILSKVCPEEVLRQPEIKNLTNLIKEENTENTIQKTEQKEIKKQEVEL